MVVKMNSKNQHHSRSSRGHFKGYLVKVADTGITITRNYSPLGARDFRSKHSLNNSLQRSATVLPIVASQKPPEWNYNNSSNSSYSTQDGNQVSSQQVSTNGQNSDVVGHQMSSEDLKHFDRKLEREREKRIHTEPPPPRLDTRGLSDNVPQFDFNMRRNGFRPTSKNSFMRADHHPNNGSHHVASFRHSHATTNPADSMGALSLTNSGAAPGALRGQSIGFGSREGGGALSSNYGGGSSRTALKQKTRAALLAGQSEKFKQNQYQFQDPVQGATPDFQQRLAELTALESDSIRYERTKKAKKKTKQDSG